MSPAAVVSAHPASPKKAASKAQKVSKPAAPMTHPKYTEMIAKAVTELKERGGSSRAGILKYILANFTVKQDPSAVNSHLKHALRSMTDAGTLKHAKAITTGAMGRFKLGDKMPKAIKKTKATAATKPKSLTKKTSVRPKSAKPKQSLVKSVTIKPSSAAKAPKTAAKVPKAAAMVPRTAVKVPKAAVRVPKAAVKVPKATVKVPKAAVKVPKAAIKVSKAASHVSTFPKKTVYQFHKKAAKQ